MSVRPPTDDVPNPACGAFDQDKSGRLIRDDRGLLRWRSAPDAPESYETDGWLIHTVRAAKKGAALAYHEELLAAIGMDPARWFWELVPLAMTPDHVLAWIRRYDARLDHRLDKESMGEAVTIEDCDGFKVLTLAYDLVAALTRDCSLGPESLPGYKSFTEGVLTTQWHCLARLRELEGCVERGRHLFAAPMPSPSATRNPAPPAPPTDQAGPPQQKAVVEPVEPDESGNENDGEGHAATDLQLTPRRQLTLEALAGQTSRVQWKELGDLVRRLNQSRGQDARVRESLSDVTLRRECADLSSAGLIHNEKRKGHSPKGYELTAAGREMVRRRVNHTNSHAAHM